MNITPTQERSEWLTAGQLKPGDVFIRNASHNPKNMSLRQVYLVLWPHTRFECLKRYTSTKKAIICVTPHNGKITSVDKCQRVIQLDARGIELPVMV